MNGLWIYAQPDAALTTPFFELVEQRLGHDPLSVIADNHRSGLRKRPLELPEKPARIVAIESIATFPIDPDNLLLVSDDSGLHASRARRIGDQSCWIDFMAAKQIAQLSGGRVLSDHGEQLGSHIQAGKIAGHVGGAARHEILALEFDHRHRRFGRYA